MRITGISATKKEKIWVAQQEKDNSQRRKYIHMYRCLCVCVLCTMQPHLHSGKIHILQKKVQAEIELLSDHISYYSFHVLYLQSFIHTNIRKQQNYAVCYK